MVKNKELFKRLLREALEQDFFGWDFSYIKNGWCMAPTSWDYRLKVLEKLKTAKSLLDMGTGGGEFLSSIGPLPEKAFATEGYPPNLPIARSKLEPLGIKVLEIKSEDILPFGCLSFDLVINRHESYSANEVYRILKKGGIFITQQVGGRDNIRLNELLKASSESEYSYWNLNYGCNKLKEAGFTIKEKMEEFPETVVTDIGAVVYYLTAIPWQIPDFTVEKYYRQLHDLHSLIQDKGNIVLTSHRFYIEVQK